MTAAADEMSQKVNARLRAVLALHFDPEGGSPYWIERAAALGFDPRERIRTVEDLRVLGPMKGADLAERPVEDFIPGVVAIKRTQRIVAETAGTLGRPKFAVHREDEFEAAFVQPFVCAARRVNFPSSLNWLFLGPTGPHIIGKAARACAKALGSPDPFTVDFDPRWAKKLPDNSFARKRYLEHIEAQALQVLETQRIGVVFATPPVLESLAEKIPSGKREAIRGIHFGGLPTSDALRLKLAEFYPNAVQLSGYGNTLLGLAPELAFRPGVGLDYFPWGARLLYWIVPHGCVPTAETSTPRVAYGERGQVLAHRLDELQFIPNLLERDTAVRIPPLSEAAEDGFGLDGLRDPQPLMDQQYRPALGLY